MLDIGVILNSFFFSSTHVWGIKEIINTTQLEKGNGQEKRTVEVNPDLPLGLKTLQKPHKLDLQTLWVNGKGDDLQLTRLS